MAQSKGGTPVTLEEIIQRNLNDELITKTRPDGTFFSATGGPLTPQAFVQKIMVEVAPYVVNGWPEINVNNAVVKAEIDLGGAKYARQYVTWAELVNNNTIAPWQVDARLILGIPANFGLV